MATDLSTLSSLSSLGAPTVSAPRIGEATRRIAIGLKWHRQAYWSLAGKLASSRPYMQLVKRTAPLDGDVVECGVYRGRSLIRMAATLKNLAPHKTLYGLDSFEGFPLEAVNHGDLGPGRSMEKVRRRFQNVGAAPLRLERLVEELGLNVQLVPGYFEHTLPKLTGRRLSFVHLDCDIYESYRTCLKHLYEAVVPGGVILFDEYACSVWPGATRAVEEFFAKKPEHIERCDDPKRPEKPKFFVVKR